MQANKLLVPGDRVQQIKDPESEMSSLKRRGDSSSFVKDKLKNTFVVSQLSRGLEITALRNQFCNPTLGENVVGVIAKLSQRNVSLRVSAGLSVEIPRDSSVLKIGNLEKGRSVYAVVTSIGLRKQLALGCHHDSKYLGVHSVLFQGYTCRPRAHFSRYVLAKFLCTDERKNHCAIDIATARRNSWVRMRRQRHFVNYTKLYADVCCSAV